MDKRYRVWAEPVAIRVMRPNGCHGGVGNDGAKAAAVAGMEVEAEQRCTCRREGLKATRGKTRTEARVSVCEREWAAL